MRPTGWRVALVVALVAAIWAVVIAYTGGFAFEIGGREVSSRRASHPAAVAVVAAAGTWLLSTPRQRRGVFTAARAHLRAERGVLRAIYAAPARAGAAFAIAAALSVATFGLTHGLFVASGADAYGYVSQADLWARGELVVRQPWAEAMVWRGADEALAPLGYRPHRPAPHGTDIVPIYSPGVPMLMAVFKRVGGDRAVYYVVPLLGGLAVWATFLLGRRLAGPFAGFAGAALVASSPTLLFEVTAPASDVAATAWWTLAFLALTFESRPASLGAGLATSAAILTRPNVAPLALVLTTPFVWRTLRATPGGMQREAAWRAMTFAAGASPGVLVIAILNSYWYGSPLSSGYGSLDDLYDLSNAATNLARYARWITDTQTPAVWLSLAAPFVVARHVAGGRVSHPRATASLWLVAAAVLLGAYVFYQPFEDWWYLRFLLPVYPLVFVLVGVTLQALVAPIERRLRLAHGLIAGALVAALAVGGVSVAMAEGAAVNWEAEQRYRTVGQHAASTLPARAAILTLLHSGSIRHYADRVTLRFDRIRPVNLDLVVDELGRLGYQPYLLIDQGDEMVFRRRFSGRSRYGDLDWPPRDVLHGGMVRLYDPADRSGP